jgi:hypothetical protein
VKESVQVAQVAVSRKNGADGEVSISWRTIDKTAVNGKDYQGGEGVLVFKHAEVSYADGVVSVFCTSTEMFFAEIFR